MLRDIGAIAKRESRKHRDGNPSRGVCAPAPSLRSLPYLSLPPCPPLRSCRMSSKWDAYHSSPVPPPWESGAPSTHLLAALSDGSLPCRGRALEVGCGNGASTRALSRCAGFSAVAGVDVSPAALARAAAAGGAEGPCAVEWLLADLLAEETGALTPWLGACDVVFDLQVYHTFPKEGRPAAAAAIARLLAPRGRLLLLAGSDGSEGSVGSAVSAAGPPVLGPPRLSAREVVGPFLEAGLRLLRPVRATRFDETPSYGPQPPLAWECLFEKAAGDRVVLPS